MKSLCAHLLRRVDPFTVAAADRILSTVVGHPTQFTQVEFISERGYRAILIKHRSIVESDSIFETALVRACGSWMLNTLTRHLESALRKDLTWGISTTRQRILARLEAFITTIQEFNQLPGLRGTVSRLLDLLQQRWRGTPSLPDYPAFR